MEGQILMCGPLRKRADCLWGGEEPSGRADPHAQTTGCEKMPCEAIDGGLGATFWGCSESAWPTLLSPHDSEAMQSCRKAGTVAMVASFA